MNFFYFADVLPTGRINTAMLSDLEIMEIMYTPLNDQPAHKVLKGDPNDVSTWEGVRCDDEGHIVVISWMQAVIVLRGSVDFSTLPPRLESFYLMDQLFEGEIKTTNLPENLRTFSVFNCPNISGTLDVGQLPRTLTSLVVKRNCVTSLQNVRNLPPNLERFVVCERFVEENVIEIGKLPTSMAVDDRGFAVDLQIDLRGSGISEVVCEVEADKERVLYSR